MSHHIKIVCVLESPAAFPSFDSFVSGPQNGFPFPPMPPGGPGMPPGGPMVRMGGFQVTMSSNGSTTVVPLSPSMMQHLPLPPPEVLKRIMEHQQQQQQQNQRQNNNNNNNAEGNALSDMSPEDMQELFNDPENQARIKVILLCPPCPSNCLLLNSRILLLLIII